MTPEFENLMWHDFHYGHMVAQSHNLRLEQDAPWSKRSRMSIGNDASKRSPQPWP